MNKLLFLNDIFKNISCLDNVTYKKARHRTLSINDALLYRFRYTKLHNTKQEIVSLCNYEKNMSMCSSSYERKEKNIRIETYEFIYNKVRALYEQLCEPSKDSVIAVDGTYSNTNIDTKLGELQTSLNMGYYDVTNNVPIDLTYSGTKRNTEIKKFMDYIEKNKLKNIIITADRGYFKYELFNFLTKNNIKYVIRLKENSHIKNNNSKGNINYELINKLEKESRVIENKITIKKTVTTKNHTKEKIMVKQKYKLITNLLDDKVYTDLRIIDIYKSRWKIETFFKLLKTNFKFENMKEKKEFQYKKLILCELIVFYLIEIITHVFIEEHGEKLKCSAKVPKKYTKKINTSNSINGIYSTILKDIIYGELSYDKLMLFAKTHIVFVQNKTNRSFSHTSKTPFTKWYVKGYTDVYKYTKIITAIKNNTLNELHSNLKTIAKNIQILEK